MFFRQKNNLQVLCVQSRWRLSCLRTSAGMEAL